MKKLITILLSAALLFSLSACKKKIPEGHQSVAVVSQRVIYGAGGGVKTRIQYTYGDNGMLAKEVCTEYDSLGEEDTRTERTYNEKGHEILCEIYSLGELDESLRTEYAYDDRGRVVKTTRYDAFDEVTSTEENTYKNGNLVKQVVYDEFGDVACTRTCEYNENNQLTQEEERDGYGDLAGITQYTYENGNLVLIVGFDEFNEEYFRSTLTYDDAGRLIAMEDGEGASRYEYRYDKNGNRTDIILFEDGEEYTRTSCEYDKDGNLKKVNYLYYDELGGWEEYSFTSVVVPDELVSALQEAQKALLPQ